MRSSCRMEMVLAAGGRQANVLKRVGHRQRHPKLGLRPQVTDGKSRASSTAPAASLRSTAAFCSAERWASGSLSLPRLARVGSAVCAVCIVCSGRSDGRFKQTLPMRRGSRRNGQDGQLLFDVGQGAVRSAAVDAGGRKRKRHQQPQQDDNPKQQEKPFRKPVDCQRADEQDDRIITDAARDICRKLIRITSFG